MAKLNIVSLSAHIIRTYSSFAGHPIYFGSANIQVFRELLKMDAFFQHDHSAVSCNFDALTKGGKPSVLMITRESGGSKEAGGLYSVTESFT